MQEVVAHLPLWPCSALPPLTLFFFFRSSVTNLPVHLSRSVSQTAKVLLLIKMEPDNKCGKAQRFLKGGNSWLTEINSPMWNLLVGLQEGL